MADKEEARRRVAELVDGFQSLSPQRRRGLNERQTGASFIEPLFEALGWSVRDPQEVSLEVTVARERADYIFRLNGVTQFIVEAKAAPRDLNNPEFKKQAITYAYNKGGNWAVLTNFSRLLVFNAETERQFLSLSADNFVDSFDDLWLLSKEAFASGLFRQRAEAYGAMQPRLPVEKSLFDQLRQWREDLFTNIFQYNDGLTLAQVDESIQQLLNRLIFIRTAEDRDLEENKLRATLHQWQTSGRHSHLIEPLRGVFHEFAHDYDSDLFPRLMDSWDAVFVDDPLLEQIIEGLYDRPGRMAGYDFSAIDADVLGAVYEQYLGHVAEAAKERARQEQAQLELFGTGAPTIKLEGKRERRKAQGIYYTPAWVVDYIVRQTVGRFLAERSHDEIVNMKILDPACGSGSFLIRAYDELLAYHARVRGKTPAELDWPERIGILTRNIFGVDLDDQAVQIARLNLLVRALMKRELLPSLRDNIRRGNSLISGGEAELRPYFGDAWREKRPFTWEQEFPDIMARGGFDVVIGNPPYVRPHKLDADYKKALWAQYPVYKAKSDIYACFIQKAIDLLKPGGLACYIVSNTFMSLESFAPLRSYILSTCRILGFGLPSQLVFREATVETIVLILRKEPEPQKRIYNIVTVAEHNGDSFEMIGSVPQESFCHAYLNMFDLSWGEKTLPLFNKVEVWSDKLSEVCSFRYGLKTGDDKVFLSVEPSSPQHRRLLRRSDFGRYETNYKGEYVWYVPERMKQHRATARPGDPERFEQPKLLVQDIGKSLVAAFDNDDYYVKDALMFLQKSGGPSLKFLLGLVNSRLLNHWYTQRFKTLSVAKNAILELPIRRIDFDNPEEKAMHDRLVALVERMLALHRSAFGGDKLLPQSEREDIEREIARTDREIDTLVYDLYGLTEEERRLVEQA